MEQHTFNRKEAALFLGVSGDTIDDLTRRGELKRLTAFGGVRYGLNNLLKVSGCYEGKTVREKELERIIKDKDEHIERLIRLMLENGIMPGYAKENA